MKGSGEEGSLPPFLVTSAAGKTGFEVVKQFVEMRLPVRAFVHRKDERSDKLQELGAEVVVGDFFDMQSLRSALTGIKRVYLCLPPMDGLLEATVNFALAGREVGIEAVVNMSQLHAREGHPSSLTRQHWLGERVLDLANIGATHLRCSFFAEVYSIVSKDTIATEGKFYLPYGDGTCAPVTCSDIARVVTGVLRDPKPHAGKVYKVTGPTLMSQKEVAAIFSEALKKPVEYVDLPIPHWQQAAAAFGFPPFLIDHLSRAAEDYQKGVFAELSDVVYTIGGQKPQEIGDYICAHTGDFSDGPSRQAEFGSTAC